MRATRAAAVAYGFSGSFPLGFVARLDPEPGRWWDPTIHLLVPVGIGLAVISWLTVAMLLAARASDVRSASLRSGPRWSITRVHPLAAAVAVRLGIMRTAPDSRAGPIAVAGLAVVLTLLVGSLTFGSNLTDLVDRPDRFGTRTRCRYAR